MAQKAFYAIKLNARRRQYIRNLQEKGSESDEVRLLRKVFDSLKQNLIWNIMIVHHNNKRTLQSYRGVFSAWKLAVNPRRRQTEGTSITHTESSFEEEHRQFGNSE